MQFYQRLCETHPGMEARVVFMTGGTLLPDVHRFLADTPNPCLEKPVPIKRLRTCIDDRVRKHRAGRPGTQS
jgi:hypothetical protein